MRISEIYLSVQGEGPRVGIPTVFIRFGGCNLRCPGWPCDTPHAIFPEKYRNEWKVMSPEEITEEVLRTASPFDTFNVCLTGGEPFLQKSDDVMSLVVKLYETEKVTDVECFSNGALSYPENANDLITFILDWKLPGSGESTLDKNRLQNVKMLREDPTQAIKFTIKNHNDYTVARRIWMDHLRGYPIQVYYGVVWNELTNSQLISWVLEDALPWRLTMQVHNHIWDRRKRGI